MKWLDRALIVLPYFYCLCLSEKEYRSALKDLDVPRNVWPPFMKSENADATVHFFEKPDGGKCAIICLSSTEGKSTAQVHSLLVHEAVHLWQQTREIIGEDKPSCEFEAYAIQSISQRLIEAYDYGRTKKKKSKKK